ncbi:hypothetical protein [Pseudomonas sp. HLT2-19-2]
MKCSAGLGGVEAQDQKIAAFGISWIEAGRNVFSIGEKKGLAKQDLS